MLNASGIYGSTTLYLLQMITFYLLRINSRHYVLDHPYLNYNSIDNYKREISLTFMLEYCVYITRSLN